MIMRQTNLLTTIVLSFSTLNASLVELKCESDLMAQEHSKVGAAFHESARRIATLMTTQRNQWKQVCNLNNITMINTTNT